LTAAEQAAQPGIDRRTEASDVLGMAQDITIDARWDAEAAVWIATSKDVPGLVVEADTWRSMIDEVRLVLPELLELNGLARDSLSLTFKAEEHLDLANV
jgi:hypothetical protein